MRPIALGLVLPLLLLSPPRARAEDEDPKEAPSDPLAGLSGARALEFARELAADGMQGRRSGVQSGRRAEDWMVGQLGNLGVMPMDPDGTYTNAFIFGTTIVSPPISLKAGDTTLEYGKDFIDLIYSGAGVVEAEVVFVGYGISASDRGLDDYAGVDVKGKIVLALRGAPPARESEFLTEKAIGWKSSHAADLGAAAFLVCEGKTAVQGTIQARYVRPALPAVWVTAAVADALMKRADATPEQAAARTLDALQKVLEPGTKSASFATGAKARLEVNSRYYPTVEARNIIGGFRGKDPDLRHEAIVIGAHLDHLGTDATGRVFNGADDNASGSSSLLMLLETLARNRWAPKRTVVFAWFAAEEQGLEGSKAMVREPVFEARHIVAMLNMDMTGQGRPAVKLGGRDGYPAMWNRIMAFVPAADRTVLNPFWAEENSDHWPFYDHGIPAFFAVTDGEHPNYHQLEDDAANLKPECLEAAARVVGRILVGLADVPTPLHTGREAAGYVLHGGARAVEGAGSAKALDAMLARPREAAADRTAFVDPGWAGVIVAIDERPAQGRLTFAKLDESIRRRAAEAVLVRTAGDLANGPKSGRTAILPRYVCPETARTSPAEFEKLRELGVRWIDPFDLAKPPGDVERDAILAAAVGARLIVDLTSLPAGACPAARAKLGTHPAIWRASAPMAAGALAERRKALGPHTLMLLSGGAEDSVLSAAALAAPADPSLAPVAVVSEDTARLEDLLAPASFDLEAPTSAQRLSVRSLFGGAIASLLRRVR